MRQCTSGSFGNYINIYDTSRSGEFLLCENTKAQSLPEELTELQSMTRALVWASPEFSVPRHKLGSTKSLGKEIMRGLDYIISKITTLENIHF